MKGYISEKISEGEVRLLLLPILCFRCCSSSILRIWCMLSIEVWLILVHLWWLELFWWVTLRIKLRLVWHWICYLSRNTTQYVLCWWGNITKHWHCLRAHLAHGHLVLLHRLRIIHCQEHIHFLYLFGWYWVPMEVCVISFIPTLTRCFDSYFLVDLRDTTVFTVQV